MMLGMKAYERLKSAGIICFSFCLAVCILTGRIDSVKHDWIGMTIAILGITAIVLIGLAYWIKEHCRYRTED